MSNAFESGERKVIPAVLIYARSCGRVLMIHRNARDASGDYHSGKWNGLGGKLEPGESPWEGARREFHEESGVELSEQAFECLGWLQFPDFKAHQREDWMVFVFSLELPEAEAGKIASGAPTDEGTLHWIPEADLLQLNLWPGDAQFLPRVIRREKFQGTLWYRGQTLERVLLKP